MLALQLTVEKITIDKADGTPAVYYQNKEMQSLYNPFLIVYSGDTISRLLFKRHDSLWAKNFKRAMASALQVQGSTVGAFVVKEVSIRRAHLLNETSTNETPPISSLHNSAEHPWCLLDRILRVE